MKSRNSLKNPTKKGGVRMKKTLILTFFALLSVAMFYGIADAAVCSSCHTMHNSQNGSPENTDGPFAQLLRADCVECHSAAAGSESTTDGAPRVLAESGTLSAQGAGQTLAGGDFYWASNDSDTRGHNPDSVGADGTMASNTPPGWDAEATNANAPSGYAWGSVNAGASSWTSQLRCAGTYGCHGNHTDADELLAIQGTHHNNGGADPFVSDGVADCTGGAIGDCYRFLGGIIGYEDSDYQWTASSSDHNEYAGEDDTNTERDDGDTTDYTNDHTISFLCAQCHGEFHASIDIDASFGSPWVRHPTDIVLPSTGEYGSYNVGVDNNYSVLVPVARGTIGTVESSTVTEGATTATGAIVMCLSCHRAHGSPEEDLLRFTYDNIDAGAGANSEGCFVCHTTKDTS
jgi:predicted CXXCH cytochrome family protein